MTTTTFEPKFFLCTTHEFVISCPKPGEMTSRGTPKHRVAECDSCTQAVNDAFDYCMEDM